MVSGRRCPPLLLCIGSMKFINEKANNGTDLIAPQSRFQISASLKMPMLGYCDFSNWNRFRLTLEVNDARARV